MLYKVFNNKNDNISWDGNIILVTSVYYKHVSTALNNRIVHYLKKSFFQGNYEEYHVHGSSEIPIALSILIKSFKNIHGCIISGCILHGETDHGSVLSYNIHANILEQCTRYALPVSHAMLSTQSSTDSLKRTDICAKNAVLALKGLVILKKSL